MMPARLAAALLAFSTAVSAFPSRRFTVPNGDRVPCPQGASGCEKTDGHCWGLGHATCHGGSFPLNPFGLDLQKAGHKWTKTLCEKDSDADGVSNGEELGDPCCIWGAFDIPSDYTASFSATHPGIATEKPTNYARPACAITTPKTKAPVMGLFNPNEEQRVAEVYINNYTLPMPGGLSNRTHYATFAWNFPDDSADMFHVVKADTILKTPKNLHHYIVNGCSKKFPDSQHGKMIGAGMECSLVWGGWAPGKAILEMPPWAGRPVGKAVGVVAFSVSVHFDNPDHEVGVVINDGMRLHYTPTLRSVTPSGLTIMSISENPSMLIPGRERRYFMTRKCTVSVKDRKTEKDVEARLLSGSFHAHLLGIEAYSERIRDGVSMPLVEDNVWYFDDQYANILYPKNITLKTGDILQSTCVFNSQGRANATVIGAETTDEMCWSSYSFAQGGLRATCFGDVWTGSLNNTEPGLGLGTRHAVTEADSVFDGSNVMTGGSLKSRNGQMKEVFNQFMASEPCKDHSMIKQYCGSLSWYTKKTADCDKTYTELGYKSGAFLGDLVPLQACRETACNGACSAHNWCSVCRNNVYVPQCDMCLAGAACAPCKSCVSYKLGPCAPCWAQGACLPHCETACWNPKPTEAPVVKIDPTPTPLTEPASGGQLTPPASGGSTSQSKGQHLSALGCLLVLKAFVPSFFA